MNQFPAIYNYACTNTGKEEASKEFREYIARFGLDRNSVFLAFMSEVDNVCPDLALRAEYRKKIKDQ